MLNAFHYIFTSTALLSIFNGREVKLTWNNIIMKIERRWRSFLDSVELCRSNFIALVSFINHETDELLLKSLIMRGRLIDWSKNEPISIRELICYHEIIIGQTPQLPPFSLMEVHWKGAACSSGGWLFTSFQHWTKYLSNVLSKMESA